MTVTYTAEVATCRGFGCFLKLLARWRGSIYKLVWMDLIAFLILYYLLSCVYRYALNENQKTSFETVVQYCNSYGSLIPLSFVLGFYVTIVMTRWWDEYMTIPWPDPVAVYVSAHVHGQDERGRVMRRTVMRYVCLCLTMVLINMSPRVKKRFPTMDHLVDAGLLVESEKVVIQSFEQKFPKHPKNWMPIVWASSIITRARKEGRIRDDFSLKTIIDELNKFRGMCTVLMHYDTISIPLVYTQVVTLAVYSYFLCNVMGKQWTEKPDSTGYYNMVDKYFPVFTTLEFFFYMGWLKVAESLINPFGEDDDDFEVNWLIDRNLQVSYLIVDEMHHEHPELIKDQYWDEVFPNELPYNKEAEGKREEPPEPSTAKYDIPKSNLQATLSSVKVDKAESSTQVTGRSRSAFGDLKVRASVMFKNLVNKGGEADAAPAAPPSSESSSESIVDNSGEQTMLNKYDESPNARIEFKQPIRPRRLLDEIAQEEERRQAEVTDTPVSTRDDRARSFRHRRLIDEITEEEEEEYQRTLTNQQESRAEDARPPLSQMFPPGSELSFRSARGYTSSENLETESSRDDFERLRQEREKERLERQKQKVARSIGSMANAAHLGGEAPATSTAAATRLPRATYSGLTFATSSTSVTSLEGEEVDRRTKPSDSRQEAKKK